MNSWSPVAAPLSAVPNVPSTSKARTIFTLRCISSVWFFHFPTAVAITVYMQTPPPPPPNLTLTKKNQESKWSDGTQGEVKGCLPVFDICKSLSETHGATSPPVCERKCN